MSVKLKRMRTKCQVKGCRSTGIKVDTFNVSVSSEFGKGVVMCSECIKGAYEALMEMQEAVVATDEEAKEETIPEKATKKRSKKAEA